MRFVKSYKVFLNDKKIYTSNSKMNDNCHFIDLWLCFPSVLKDTKLKIEKMKAYQESLMECLGDLLERHIPHPQNGANTNETKVSWAVFFGFLFAVCCLLQLWFCQHYVLFQNVNTDLEEDVISLGEMLEVSLILCTGSLFSGVLLNLNMINICMVIVYYLT